MPKFRVDVEASYASWQDAMTSVARSSDQTAKQIESAFGRVDTAIKGVIGASIGAFVVQQFTAVTAELDNLAKSAQSVGLTTEALSSLRYAASYAGLEADQLDRALTKLAARVSDVAKGNKEAAEVFARMGVSIKAQNGEIKSTDELLGDIADKFATYRAGINKTALAVDLFGEKIGPKLIPLLNGGRAGLQASAEEAEKLGLAIGSNLATAAEKLNDEMARLNVQWKAFKIGLLEDVIPYLAGLVEAFNQARLAGLDFEKTLRSFAGPWGDYNDMLANELSRLEDMQRRRAEMAGADYEDAAARFGGLSAADVQRQRAALDEEIRQQTELTRILARKGQAVEAASVAFESVAAGAYGGTRNAPGAAASVANQITAADRLLESLQKQLESAQELSVYERTLLDIDRQREAISAGKRGEILDLARKVDASKEAAQATKDEAEFRQFLDRVTGQYDDRLRKEIERYKDLADPAARYARELERIAELRETGGLTDQQADANTERIYAELAALDKMKGALDDTVDATRKLGLTFESAFEKAVFEGGKLLDVVRAIVIDFAKIAVRQGITKPLFDFASSFITGAPNLTPEQQFHFANPEIDNLVPQVTSSAAALTVNVAAGVSMSQVTDAVARGVSIGQAQVLDSRMRGGAFA